MKVFFGVLALLVAVAATEVVVDHPVEQPVVRPVVRPAEEQRIAPQPHGHDELLVKLDPSAKMISLYSIPNLPESQHIHERGGMPSILNGPVMVAFKDAKEDKMNAYLFPKGLKRAVDYNVDDIRPVSSFLIHGGKKAFIYHSAASYLQLPEMSMPVNEIHLPSYDLKSTFSISKNASPYPFIIIVDLEYIKSNSRFEKLKEVGVFGVGKEGLTIIRNNYSKEDQANSRSLLFFYPEKDQVRDYFNPYYAEKDFIRKYINPVYAEKDLVRKYTNPAYADESLVRDYLNPVGKDIIRDYLNPVYAEKDIVAEYNPVYASKDLVRGYPYPVLTERDQFRKYLNPTYAEKDLVREYLNPVYAETDPIRRYFAGNPIYEKDLIREYL